MAVAADYSGWVKELDHYEAHAEDEEDGDERVETTRGRGLSSRGGSIATGRKSKPRATTVSEELKQEMKLLNWHKLANEAALKAAIIKTNKIKNEESRFSSSLANEDVEEKRQRIQQIIEEEQLRPLQVNTEFFREFEAREQRDESKTEMDVQRHIQHLRKLKETMAQREDLHRRRQRYKEGMAELGGGLKSHSVPKGHKSNQDEELSGPAKRHHRSMSTTQKSETTNAEVICSLDKLMELEKRIRHLEDAGLGVDGLDGDGDGGITLNDIDDNNLASTKNLRFSKRKSSGPGNEPSRTMYAVKTVAKARAKDPMVRDRSQGSTAARKRSLPSKQKAPDTFLTSLPENKQRQLRRMTDRERRNFLKNEKAQDVRQQQQKQDVVIQDWMQKKKQAAQQRKTIQQHATASSAAGAPTRKGAGKPLPPPPQVRPPARGAAAGKHIANPHLQKFDDIRKGFDKRKEAMSKQSSSIAGGSNKVLELRTAVNDKPHKKPGALLPATRQTVGKAGAVSSITSNSRPAPEASLMPAASYPRRPSGDLGTRLPVISRAPPLPSPAMAPQMGFANRQATGSSVSMAPAGSSAARMSGVALPRLHGASRPMPSPPPASSKNRAMPQFSRLHKR